MAMKKIILFSQATEKNREQILDLIFPQEIKNKILAYVPSDGANCPQKYIDEWIDYAKDYKAEFNLINNSTDSPEEKEKLDKANILVITGGNTFTLLRNLKKSGLDKSIKDFVLKKEFVLAGFSAGAIVLTPTISICGLPGYDENLVELKDLTGFNLVGFEVFPHYSDDKIEILQKYRATTKNEVKTITNDEFIVIEP